MPAFSENDIKQYKTAKTVGSVTSLGGAITATEVGDGTPFGMFDLVTKEQAESGITEYRIVAFKNINTAEDCLNPRVGVISDSSSPNTTFAVGWMPTAISAATEELTSETDSPTGVVWCESARLQDFALLNSNIPRNGGYAFLALRRTVKAGAQPYKKDRTSIVFICDNLDVGVPTPTGPPTPPVIDVGVVGEIDINEIWKKIFENFKLRNMSLFFTCGNNIGGTITDPAHTATDFTSMFGEIMRKLCWPVFGQRDRLPVVTNTLRSFFGVPKTFYTKTHYNIHFTMLDTSDPSVRSYELGSEQYTELKTALENAKNNPAIDWRIVIMNRAAYAAGTTPDRKKFLDETLQEVWAPLFEENMTHMVVQGTYANTQIAHVLRHDPGDPATPIEILTGQAPNYSFTGAGFDRGVLYVLTGSGGFPFDVINDPPSFIRYAQSIHYGGFRFRFDSSGQNKILIGDFIDSNDKLIPDARFTITKL